VVVEQSRAADRRKPFFIAAAAALILGAAGWAVFQNVAAAQGADRARTMSEQRDNLAPLKTQIDGLLKKEAALRQIAGGFTGAEADHAFWLDMLAEVRDAFASDAVWLIDFEPIHGYDPAAALAPKTAGNKTQNGKSVVKAEFFNTQFGSTSLADIQIQEPTQQKGKQAAAAPKALTANAVRIRGLWRENPKSQNVVSELLKNLREKSTNFKFTVKDAKGNVTLSDEQILSITVEGKPGDLGLPFEITLPLAREVAIK
jgi:hypothetical protein